MNGPGIALSGEATAGRARRHRAVRAQPHQRAGKVRSRGGARPWPEACAPGRAFAVLSPFFCSTKGAVPDRAVAAVTAALRASQARRGAQELPPSGRHCIGYVWSPTPKAPAFVYGERAALSRRISAIPWLTSRAILARASNAATICASFFSRVSPHAVSSSRTKSLISLRKLM